MKGIKLTVPEIVYCNVINKNCEIITNNKKTEMKNANVTRGFVLYNLRKKIASLTLEAQTAFDTTMKYKSLWMICI